jgi:hypothetical protein
MEVMEYVPRRMEVTEVMAMQITHFAAVMARMEVIPYLAVLLTEETVENTEMEEMVVWHYSAVLLTDRMVLAMATEKTVVWQWDRVVWLMVKMDMKAD